MRCPECGTNLFERTERNAEGTVEKTFNCYNCGSIWRPDSEDDVPDVESGNQRCQRSESNWHSVAIAPGQSSQKDRRHERCHLH